jgi:putative ABC transport system permease protein
MYVSNELSYESVHENGDRIYRVNVKLGNGDQAMKMAGAMAALGPAAAAEIPEVKKAVRFVSPGEMKISFMDKEFIETKFRYTDPSVFQVFTFPLVEGDKTNPFPNVNSVVITESTAKKLFGSANAIGKILRAGDTKDLVVSAVAKDIQLNTRLQWNYLVPIESYRSVQPGFPSWNQFGDCFTYLLLNDGVSSSQLDAKLNRLFEKNAGGLSSILKLHTMKLTDIYLRSDISSDIGHKGNITYIYLFSVVAFLILLIASFNFINLSTVRSVQRSKEVGLKKVLGASRFGLIKQFLSESFLVTFISVVLSLILFQFLNPVLCEFLKYKIAISNFENAYFYLSVIGITLLVGFASGIFPALILSRFNPIETLKGISIPNSGRLPVRKTLVIAQLVISIFLISCTIAVFQQLNYLKNADLGLDKSNVVLLDFPASPNGRAAKYEILKDKLLLEPSIKGVSGVYTLPGINSQDNQSISLLKSSELSDSKMIRAIGVDFDFVSMMGAKIISGRNFSREYETDKNSAVLLNESAVKMLALKNAVGTSVYIPGGKNNSVREVRVVGVVKNFNIESLRNEIVPYFLYINPERFITIAIKIDNENREKTLTHIKSVWAEIMPDKKIDYTFFDESYAGLYTSEEKLGELFTIFSSLAVFTACLGLFGLSLFMTIVKTKEIGIRKVLGANIPGIMIMLNRDYIKWFVVAFLIACPIAWYTIDKWLHEFAYRMNINWWIFFLSGGIVLSLALLTVTFQVIRLATINPVESLRYE